MIDCILMAGGVPKEDDLLYEYTQGRPKALIDVAGKPMVSWVIEALEEAASVEAIIAVGLSSEDGIASAKITHYLPDRGSLLRNVLAGIDQILEEAPDTRQVLMCSSDIPLLTGEMVEAFLRQCTDTSVDIYHSLVPRERMEKRFPDSRRSYVHFSDGDFAAGDIHVIAPYIGNAHRALWDDLLNNRKNALKQALRLGPGFFTKLLMRRLSLEEAERLVLQKLGLNVRAMAVDYPEMGMDADKPFQLEICRQELAKRGTM